MKPSMILLVHILAGGLGLVAGAVALSAAKGARLHRKSGILFVYAMITMSLSGAVIAALRGIGASARWVAGGLSGDHGADHGQAAHCRVALAESRRHAGGVGNRPDQCHIRF